MISVLNKKYQKNQVLSSLNFIKQSDQVFSASLSQKDIDNFKFTDIKIIEKNNELITFINLNFNLKENDIIYTHADFVESLFDILKKFKFQNIKVISSQSDRKITKSLFNKKPKSVSSWYATNVIYNTDSLIPIPLGIAPYRNSKSAIIEDFIGLEFQKTKQKFMYANFNLNTNYFHRIKTVNSAKKIFNINLKDDKNYKDYLVSLGSHKFSLSPWGNGIDTHRFWEAMYCGTIPITKSHYIYKTFEGLPMVLLPSYKSLNNLKKEIEYDEFNLEKLDINWWMKQINNIKVESLVDEIRVNITDNIFMNIQKNFYKLRKEIARKKSILTFLRKIHQKINILHKT